MSGWHHGRTVLSVRRSSWDEGAPIGLPEAVEVVRPDAVRGVVAHGVRLPGSLAMAWRLLCALGVVLGVVAHGVKLLRS